MEGITFWEKAREYFFNELRPGDKNIIISYYTHRQLIGVLGWTLPIVLWVSSCLSGRGFLSSISSYYYSNMRDYMVAALFCASFFLINYKGNRRIDNWITTATGIFGFGAALFPCLNNSYTSNQLVGIFQIPQYCSKYIHLTSAVIFFLLLAINSAFLFTYDDKVREKGEALKFSIKNWDIDTKSFRNFIYILCGVIIFISLLTLGTIEIYHSIKKTDSGRIDFVGEFVMLVFFGISWSVKGKILYHIVGGDNLKIKFTRYLAKLQKSIEQKSETK